MRTTRAISLISVFAVLILFGCAFGGLLRPVETPSPAGISGAAPLGTSQALQANSSPIPTIFLTMFVNEYSAFTIYRQPALWQSAIGSNRIFVEDFENDVADFGELTDPYLTANGFLLQGEDSSATLVANTNLLPSGTVLHFRDFGRGLSFTFPNRSPVSAFAFDYRASEDWQLRINETVVPLQGGRSGFVGVVSRTALPVQFTLSSSERVQGGLSVDNIFYIPAELP